MRLIDADALINELVNSCNNDQTKMFPVWIEKQIDAQPTVVMLKEQEAVEPILKREAQNKNYNDYVCPRCYSEVVYEQNFCSECGVPFMWEGR